MNAQTVRAYIGFGANLGDPKAAFAFALERIAALPNTWIAARSPLYRSAPVGVENHPDYLNAVVAIDTHFAPHDLLDALLAIEHAGGRRREHPGVLPRTLDLDLLLYGDTQIHEPGLSLPHPRMHERAFVLRPLADIAPELSIPGHGPLTALLPMVADQLVFLCDSRLPASLHEAQPPIKT